MIRPRTPDEALVVDVARGLDSGSMIEQAYRILRQVSYSVGYHREEAMWRALCGCVAKDDDRLQGKQCERAACGDRVCPRESSL
jgi:hypothetical protein